ncbi:MAG: serine/threonine-protein kinase [Anaerolineae bacterium]|nr:serine/threonine-protein kinase [Anaerolineae bacterium]
MALTSGTILKERYKVLSTLGQGGMGAVYRAEDNHLGVKVAIKENLFLTDGYSRQFQREANILASLRHPSLPKVIDYFTLPNQGQYLIMEFIEGEDLRQRIERQTSVSDREAAVIGIVICDAIQYLHSRTQSIIHRDIKPGNIKITPEGEIVLVDFGLAKVIEDKDNPGRQDTITGARAMTPGYSPPEQYGTARTDHRSDIYSLGATLYAALTGIIPEDGLSRMTGKIQLTPLRQLNPRVTGRMATVIERALEIDPNDRYQDAETFRQAIITASELTFNTLEKLRVAPAPLEGEETSDSSLNPQTDTSTRRNRETITRLRLWFKHALKNLTTHAPLIILGTIILFIFWVIASNPLKSVLPDKDLQPTITISSLLQPQQNQNEQTPTLTTGAFQTEIPQQPSATENIPENNKNNTLAGAETSLHQRIAFVSNRTGTMQVWSMNRDGSNQKQITSMSDGACQPAFSPDGKKLAVISPCNDKKLVYEKTQIFILNSDGSNPQPLPVSSHQDFDPAWSHDSTRLVFTSLRNGLPHIFLYNFSSSSFEELSDTRFADINPSWNTGDKQLAFSRLENVAYHIWLMSDKGLTQSQFSSSGEINDVSVDWSHDGEFIIFSRTPVDANVPYLVRLAYKDRKAGGEVRVYPLHNNTIPIIGARLSDDDKWITFESWPDGRNHDIFLMDLNGDNFVRLTNDPGYDFSPVWMP